MPVLKNSRHEKFALALFKGMSQKDAALEAGYKPSRAEVTASELVRNSKVWGRVKELHGEAVSEGIMTVRERKEKLSEIGRGSLPDFMTEEGIKVNKDSPNVGAVSEVTTVTKVFHKGGHPVVITKLKTHPPVPAIDLLNKMEGEYPASKLELMGKGGGPIEVEHDAKNLSDDELVEIIKRRRSRGAIKEAPSS